MKKIFSCFAFSLILLTSFALHAESEPLNTLSVNEYKGFNGQAVIFAGNANPALAQKVAEHLQVTLGSAKVAKFNDGEIQIQVQESVRNKDIFIIQSTCPSQTQSVNDNLMELYLLARTMKRSSAASITVVIPYYGYARQDRKNSPRVPI